MSAIYKGAFTDPVHLMAQMRYNTTEIGWSMAPKDIPVPRLGSKWPPCHEHTPAMTRLLSQEAPGPGLLTQALRPSQI